MNSKERWIEETLEGFSGIKRASMETALAGHIIGRLKGREARVISIPRSTVWRVAAAIGLLVTLNAFSVSHFIRSSGISRANGASAFSQEYFSYVNQSPASF